MPHSLPLNRESLIIAWAVAECGIGGVMHALKIPFTGIFVGSVAVTCIALIAIGSLDIRKEVLKALVMVLLVKLAASPHSPWQAYVAVLFQGVLGSLILRNDRFVKSRILFFAMICLGESALQKLIFSLLIFGLEFFKAIDLVLNSITNFFGVMHQTSYSIYLMCLYLLIHLIVGFVLGSWIPKIPEEIDEYQNIFDKASQYRSIGKSERNSPKSFINLSYLALILATLIVFHLYLPSQFIWINIFLRALVLTLVISLFGGPLFKFIIQRRLTKIDSSNSLSYGAQEIINKMPGYKTALFDRWTYLRARYKGYFRFKLMFLSVIALPNHDNKNEQIDKEDID